MLFSFGRVLASVNASVQFLFSRNLLLVLTKILGGEEDWALDYTSMKFWHYCEIF